MAHVSTSTESPARPLAADARDARSTVRVLGIRLDKYVEFEFSLNDPDLTVELVMPFTAFDEFCAANGARVLAADDAEASEALARAAAAAGTARDGRPGLYRAPQARPGDTA